ncbi:MAG: paraquat-inducible protein A [Deferribacteres bacterium]|nr:paraquat-inducible protein A [candidate division KSB1 bacterium]MCB9510063.1 paraquat-inducible protein A [Deferribacteres bacterium]
MNKISLANTYPKEHKISRVFIVASLILFLVGIFAPLFTANKYIFFSRTLSLYSIMLYLISEKQYLIFLFILGFGILLPVAKLATIAHVWTANLPGLEQIKKRLILTTRLLKYFALDALFVGILIYAIKFQINARIDLQYGLYCFALSVLLTLFTSLRLFSVRRKFDHSHDVG